MVITTQRFLSFTQGENDIVKSRSMFNNSVILHIIISCIVALVLFTLYFFFFNGFLNISESSIHSAKSLYVYVTVVLCLTFMSSPFRAVIVSHENIIYISLIEILDALFKLIISYVLFWFSDDKLVIYGMLLCIIQLFNLLATSVFSYFKYPECSYLKISDFNLKFAKEMFSFAGWTMYNLLCNLGRTQGLSIALNKYFGPAVNASYGLSFQVSGAINNVSASLQNAINPQLMKAEGAGDRAQMKRLAEFESKFAFFLLSAISIPCIFEMPKLLELWLGQVPEYSVLFCRMVMLASLVDVTTSGLGAANQAIGKIRTYTLIVYSVKLVTLPVSVFCLLESVPIEYIAIPYVLFELLSSVLRIPILNMTAGFSMYDFFKNVIIKEITPFSIIVFVCVCVSMLCDFEFRFLLTFSVCIVFYVFPIYWFGLCEDEKQLIDQYIYRIKTLKIWKMFR